MTLYILMQKSNCDHSHYLGKKNKQGKLEHIEDNGFVFRKINKT